jgi:hypothetical protein
VRGNGQGDHRPLGHSSGKLVGIEMQPFSCCWNSHAIEQRTRVVSRRPFGEPTIAAAYGFDQLVTDGERWIQTGLGILEDG